MTRAQTLTILALTIVALTVATTFIHYALTN